MASALLELLPTPLALASWSLLLLVLWAGLNPLERWRLRRFPGCVGRPFLGNIPELVSHDLTGYALAAAKVYGKVFKIWFGPKAWIVISDPELVRKVGFKLLSRPFSHTESLHVLTGEAFEVDKNTLIFLKGADWRMARRAFESSITHPTSLAAHQPALDRCLARFLPRLGRSAASGEPLELCGALGELMLAAVGEVAYGVDFGTASGEGGDASPDGPGAALVSAARQCFSSLDMANASAYWLLKTMLPSLTPLWFWLAARLPDPAQRRHMAARQRIADVSRQLMTQWQDNKAAAAAAAAATAAGGEPTAAANGQPSGAANGFAEVGGGINSSSFLAALLEERRRGGADGGGAEKLTDVQVIAQCLTFLLAGFETTSTTLAFTAFLLATHPEAQERLLREIDAAAVAAEGAAPPQLPYLDAVLHESMRLLPAASALIRSPPEDLDLGDGLVIPRGQFVFLATNNFHRDPRLWPQPEAFLPHRFLPESGGALAPADPAAFAPFGVGPRMCVGNKLALMAAKSSMVALYRRFTFSLHPKQQLPLRTRTAMTHGPRDGVWVTVHAR